jgi:hypothetical protein
MRKEILFAILAGALFGLIIAFGIWRLNSTLSPSDQSSTEASPTPSATEFGITIAKPEKYQVLINSDVTVSGITKENAWVVVSSEDEDYVLQADSGGGFEAEIELIGGANQIVVTAFDNTGASVEESLILVYSAEFPLNGAAGEETTLDESTDSSEVREKVQEKVKQAQTIPFSYIGTVTDIAEDTIQLRALTGEIKQASVDDDTEYFNQTGSTSKTINFKDVAIGDFIIAMGFKNGQEVLQTKRLLVTTALESPTRKAVLGKAKSIEGKALVVESNSTETELTFPKTWKGPEIDEIENDAEIIIVYTTDGDENTIRTVFLTTSN